jgi:hypothetical protein
MGITPGSLSEVITTKDGRNLKRTRVRSCLGAGEEAEDDP